ncbi:SDR family NAD(P)-dependent oxidoreductase [Neorhizobium sp. BT27B]|uniref:SDR family NAD(P)-dependent oxidoreductase n=1 Tax=Neorhizobium sp. BT27B TaxID=3142625 RepID=UPI003D293C6D
MTKSILIVAAERGLGLGLARQFFDRGWSVVGTARQGADIHDLQRIGDSDPSRLATAFIDVTDAAQIAPFLSSLGDRRFDVIFFNAGIWGASHQNVLEATDAEFAQIMLTNTFARCGWPAICWKGSSCLVAQWHSCRHTAAAFLSMSKAAWNSIGQAKLH